MFRQQAFNWKRFASPLFRRGGFRLRSTGPEQASKSRHLPKPFWNSGRVLLFSTATGTTTYYYGANDEALRFPHLWRKTTGPQYAQKRDMEKVDFELLATDGRKD